MNLPPTSSRIPLWLHPTLWGLDIALAAFCWGLYFAAYLHVNLLSDATLVIVCAAVWICKMMTLHSGNPGEQTALHPEYYKHRGRALLFILLSLVAMVTIIWQIFWEVGRGFIVFIFPALLMLLLLKLLKRMRLTIATYAALGAAFVLGCVAPAAYYSFTTPALGLFSDKALWALVGAMMLFLYNRRPEAPAQTSPQHIGILLAVLVYTLYLNHSAPPVQQPLCTTVIITLGFIHLLSHLRSRLSFDAWSALGWPMVTLPAIIGIIQLAHG